MLGLAGSTLNLQPVLLSMNKLGGCHSIKSPHPQPLSHPGRGAGGEGSSPAETRRVQGAIARSIAIQLNTLMSAVYLTCPGHR